MKPAKFWSNRRAASGVELAEAMVKLARSRELGRQLGKAGRGRAETEFDWEKKIDQILNVYARASQSQPSR